ncbi:MAG TPA: PKD domain-containing protein [Methanosarcina sp.]|nr:PKD domain-containing protein [Methanosarcina sp.]
MTAKSEKLNGTTNISRENKDSISTYESLLAENSSDNVSSSLNNVSSAEKLTNNSTTAENETTKPTESSKNSMDSSMGLSSGSTTNSEKNEEILPVANFSSNVTEGYVPLTVQFTDLSENVTERNWDFGDGDTLSEQDPVHTYYSAGTYEVGLVTNNENGTDSKLATITVYEQPDGVIPVANFTSNVTDGFAPLTVQFTDSSENATAINWDFGDGYTSTDHDPVHTYFAAGNYSVNLTASNGNGTSSKLATINVQKQPAGVLPVANFSNNLTEGYAPLTVQFTDLSENVTEWKWDFGDGNTSGEQDPKHTFSIPGNYNINLSVSDGNGTDSKLDTITVLQPILPVANFSSNVTEGYTPLTVQFIDLSENATGISWDFGDGDTSTEKNPVHTYSAAGNYNVNLTISNENGTNSKLDIVTVSQPILPVANFSSNVTEGYAPLTVDFTDLSENVTEWKWDFGDGNTSSEQYPTHIYSASGSYKISLIANNENGTSTKTSKITVDKSPIVI